MMPRATRGEWIALGALAVFTATAVGGYAVFALHPALLPQGPAAAAVYRRAFPLFARLHILVAAAVLGVVLVGRARGRWLPAALLLYGTAFLAEHVGTGVGFPFGAYGYTGLLGPRLLGRVPVLIPVSWFLMAVPAWALARSALPGGGARRVARVALAAAALAAWDLALDPAMSHLTAYWVWGTRGPYYGMPLTNLLGWWATGCVLMAGLEATAGRWIGALPLSWLAAFYLAMLLMPLGMVAAAGLGGAVAATLLAVAALGGVYTALTRTAPAWASSSGAPAPGAEAAS